MADADPRLDGEETLNRPVSASLRDECVRGSATPVVLGHAARGRANFCTFARDQPSGSLISARRTRSNSAGVISAITVGNGVDCEGAKANGSTLPVATVAAL